MSDMFDISSLTGAQRPMGVPSVDEFLANLQQTQPQMMQGQLPDASLHTERANTMPQIPQGGGLLELIQQIMPMIQQQGEQKRQLLDQYQETPQQRNFRLQEARSPWNNGFFGSKEEQAERRAPALAENQKMLQRPAGGYQLPQVPQQQQAAPAPQVQQPAATPMDPVAKYRAELDAKYPFKGVQNMPELNQAEAGLNVANVQMDQVNKMSPNLESEMAAVEQFLQNSIARNNQQTEADAPLVRALNAYVGRINNDVSSLDKAMQTNNVPMVAGILPPATTDENQMYSTSFANSMDAAQALYDQAMGVPRAPIVNTPAMGLIGWSDPETVPVGEIPEKLWGGVTGLLDDILLNVAQTSKYTQPMQGRQELTPQHSSMGIIPQKPPANLSLDFMNKGLPPQQTESKLRRKMPYSMEEIFSR
jgi:hypothetical protein